ncbi:MAG: LytTR family transcriptional regulator DNA-binding domain-containing protein [Saprospiraceae bacterium]|nr:LytTR family transcriptional regulator DNA-binding domain-containing protein [Saprospiraceae bacterium]
MKHRSEFRYLEMIPVVYITVGDENLFFPPKKIKYFDFGFEKSHFMTDDDKRYDLSSDIDSLLTKQQFQEFVNIKSLILVNPACLNYIVNREKDLIITLKCGKKWKISRSLI